MELVGFKIFKYLNPIKRFAVDTCLELNFGTKTYIWVKGVIFTGLRMSLNFKPRFLEMIEFDCAFHFVLSVWFWWKNSRNERRLFFSFTSLWEEDYKVCLLLVAKFFEEQYQLKKICTLEINQQPKKISILMYLLNLIFLILIFSLKFFLKA